MGKISLGELLGKKAASVSGQRKLCFDDLPEILGDNMPEIDFSPVGEYRLTTALRNRFGDGFRNIAAVKDILSDYKERTEFEGRIQKLKAIKYTPPKEKK